MATGGVDIQKLNENLKRETTRAASSCRKAASDRQKGSCSGPNERFGLRRIQEPRQSARRLATLDYQIRQRILTILPFLSILLFQSNIEAVESAPRNSQSPGVKTLTSILLDSISTFSGEMNPFRMS